MLSNYEGTINNNLDLNYEPEQNLVKGLQIEPSLARLNSESLKQNKWDACLIRSNYNQNSFAGSEKVAQSTFSFQREKESEFLLLLQEERERERETASEP